MLTEGHIQQCTKIPPNVCFFSHHSNFGTEEIVDNHLQLKDFKKEKIR